MARLRLTCLTAAVGSLLLACLAGCSGGSAHGPQTASSREAPEQVAAALFVQQWSQVLWGLVTSQTATGTPSFGPPVVNPDGSVSQRYTGADGTVVVLTAFADGSATLAATYPDGSGQTTRQGVPSYQGNVTTTAWEVSASDGTAVRYTSVVDNAGTYANMADDTTDLAGTADLPDKLSQEFTAHTGEGQTVLHSAQSDGSDFRLSVPLRGPDYAYPDTGREAAASYRLAGGEWQLALSATAEYPGRWALLSSEFGDGTSGAFRLAADFAGAGQLRQDGALLALLSWTREGQMSLSPVNGGSAQLDPAGAAVDYLVHRWQTLTALFAPAPGVTAAGYAPLWPALQARHRQPARP